MKRMLSLAGAMLAAVILTALPARAKELTIGLASEPTSMDPHFHNLGPNNSLLSHLFDGLIDQDENQQLVPGLAVSWKALDDLTWEFKLRQGVKWHDGSPFTADDVIFTFERAPNVEGSPGSFGLYTKGKTLVKVDDFTIHMKTAEPWPLLPQDVSSIMIISRKNGEGATTADYNSGKAAIGTGRYKYAEYVPGDRIVMERNEGWWGNKGEWTKLTFKPIKSSPSRVAALLAGDVDLIEQTPTVDIERLKKDPNLNLSEGISNRVIYLHMDHWRDDSPFIKGKDGSSIKNPLKDHRVRLALSKAINRPAIVSRVMEDVAVPAGQLLPPGFFGVSENLKPLEYDPEGAKKLLADAGYPDGFKLTLHGPNDRYINDAKIAEAIGQMLSRIGVQTEVVTMPRSVFFNRASRGGPDGTPEFSFFLVGWGSGTGEASSPLRSLLHSYDKERGFGAANRGRYSNPEVDKLIEEAVVTIDDAKRGAALARATDLAIGDVGIIPLHYQVNVWASKKGIKYRARTDEATTAFSAYSE
ncbi:MAG: ABC transporter substrate-binding protein [Ectothiorhodospiraceae bacterium]|nr:ABC transporter substrate-binding protein [Chromatiales bacterium]MCP5154627.1 ABC transporter substrate-binding protein [Ectothiorhodospiraceae bacterium]